MGLLFPVIMVAPLVAFWIWMVDDLAHHRYFATMDKHSWVVVLLLFNVFGAAVYYWYGYRDPERS